MSHYKSGKTNKTHKMRKTRKARKTCKARKIQKSRKSQKLLKSKRQQYGKGGPGNTPSQTSPSIYKSTRKSLNPPPSQIYKIPRNTRKSSRVINIPSSYRSAFITIIRTNDEGKKYLYCSRNDHIKDCEKLKDLGITMCKNKTYGCGEINKDEIGLIGGKIKNKKAIYDNLEQLYKLPSKSRKDSNNSIKKHMFITAYTEFLEETGHYLDGTKVNYKQIMAGEEQQKTYGYKKDDIIEYAINSNVDEYTAKHDDISNYTLYDEMIISVENPYRVTVYYRDMKDSDKLHIGDTSPEEKYGAVEYMCDKKMHWGGEQSILWIPLDNIIIDGVNKGQIEGMDDVVFREFQLPYIEHLQTLYRR